MIETEPRLEDGTPFPTMWWLSCRELSKEVSKLESQGWMAQVNERLNGEPDLQRAMDDALSSYNAARDALQVIDSPKHPGGWPGKVKCLHAHVAHELMIGMNPVGKAALQEIGWVDPNESCV